MTDTHGKNEHIRTLLMKLLDAETGDDSMICHDGGFRYAGDFMSMDSSVIEPSSIISDQESRVLLARGLVARTSEGIRVTDAGRRLAYGEVE